MTPINTPPKTSITRPFLWPTFILIALALSCYALLPKAQAVVPPPDDGAPGFNTVGGPQAPQSLSEDKHTASIPQGQSYVVTDLGGLGGNLGSSADAINSSGQVVGRSYTPGDAVIHATLFSGTGFNNIDLGNLSDPPDNRQSEAYGINDSGGIIGMASPVGSPFRATLFSGTGSGNIDLGTLNNSSGGSAAYAINKAGQIVGAADFGFGGNHATLFSGTGSNSIDLGTLGGASSTAYAINNSGQIVGQADSNQVNQRATLFGNPNVDLGTLGGLRGTAYGINDAGQIVGSSDLPGGSEFHATLFSGTGSNNVDLGTLGGENSHAYAINSSGQIVGNSQFMIGNFAYHAFIYLGGTMLDINDLVLPGSGVSNIRLEDDGGRVPGKCINDVGQIAAIGDVLGVTHAILLTPGGAGTPTPTPTATPTATPTPCTGRCSPTPRPRQTPRPRP